MDDKQQAVTESGEVKTPDTTPPVAEQQTPLTDVATAEKPDKTPAKEDDLPQDKAEAGKRFAELRHKVKELEKQLEEKQSRQSSFEELQKVYAPAFQQEGVDIDMKINDKLEEFQARQQYPQLNENKAFERAVAAEYQAQLLETLYNPQAKRPSIMQITKSLAKHFVGTTVEKAVQEVKEKLTEKEQASLSAQGRSKPADNSDLSALQERSRHGDDWAIAERIARASK